MTTLKELLARSHVLAGLPDRILDEMAGCGKLAHFDAGTTIFEAGRPAGTFHIIREGRVSIELAAPGRPPVVVQTRSEGDAIGWSWLFAPYRWHFDAVASQLTRVISLDGECLRGKVGHDVELGYHLMSRFAEIAIGDLETTRLQLLDVYGHAGAR